MIGLIAIHIPIFEDHYLIGVLCVEEDAVTPGWRPFSIVYLFSLDILVGGQEVDVGLPIKRQHSRSIIQEIFVLLKQGGEVGLHIGLSQLLLSIVLLNRVEQFSHMLIFGLEAEVHIANEEAVLTLIEQSPLITLDDGVVVDILDVLLPFR